MMRYTVILLLIALLQGPLFSQGVADIAKEKPVIKLSMVPLIHIDNAFVLAGEIPLSKGRFSLQPEIGYGTAASNFWYEPQSPEEKPDKRTLRSNLQFRSYFKDGDVFRTYFGGEYAYLHSTYRQVISGFPIDAMVDPNIRTRRTAHAIRGILGWQGYFSNRISIDFHVGFGLRMSKNALLSRGPVERYEPQIRLDERDWLRRSKNLGSFGPYPDLTGAVQLGFILGKLD